MKKLLILPLLFAGSLFAQQSTTETNKTKTQPKLTTEVAKEKVVVKTSKKSNKKTTVAVDVKNSSSKGTLVNLLDEAVIENKTKEQLAKPE